MDAASLGNSEAVLNIFANLSEIAGLRYALGFIVAAVLIVFLRKWRVALVYFLIGIAVGVPGLAAPGIVNWLVAALLDAKAEHWLGALAVIAGILALVVFVVAMAMFAFPFRVAKDQNNTKHARWIIGLSLASLLFAPLWSIALLLAHMDDKTPAPEADNPPIDVVPPLP